ncbi:MAG TPA: type II toxin-antitoxin system prevent-host-death family antitoxin [Rhizomicrobium sp.]|nr:type II toxin-antitoxin system prevent-host-death family antitoxin [Rhizomicrobium sp.]
MAQATVQAFRRRFGEFRHRARHEPVEITRRGRRELVLISAKRYDWLMAAIRRNHRTTDAPQFVRDAVARAEMDSRHVHLDKLIT